MIAETRPERLQTKRELKKTLHLCREVSCTALQFIGNGVWQFRVPPYLKDGPMSGAARAALLRATSAERLRDFAAVARRDSNVRVLPYLAELDRVLAFSEVRQGEPARAIMI